MNPSYDLSLVPALHLLTRFVNVPDFCIYLPIRTYFPISHNLALGVPYSDRPVVDSLDLARSEAWFVDFGIINKSFWA